MVEAELLIQSRFEALPQEDPACFFMSSVDRSEPYRCLVAEDDPIILELVAEMIDALGFQVDMARDGSQALNRMAACRYDLVVSDLEMPVVNGFHLAVRSKRQYQDIKFIIMTGRCPAEVTDMMRSGVVDAWIFKPFSLKELCGALDAFGLPAALRPPAVASAAYKRHQM